jgi:p-hydroxybenzoate 3-monooxygenase
MSASRHTRVAIVGAGPAGLVLGNLLLMNDVECMIVDRHSRDHLESRTRAGIFEHRTVEFLDRYGLAGRLQRDGRQVGVCEFRIDGERLVLDYRNILGGSCHVVYPQQKIVRDLIQLFQKNGGLIYFSASDTTIEGIETARPMISFNAQGDRYMVRCDIIAGCDGDNGVCRRSIPRRALRRLEYRHPYYFLSILAAVRPLAEWTVYALHHEGFAGQMLRSPEVTRFYVQCPMTDSPDEWPDDRIWSTLRSRLAANSGSVLETGPVLDKDVLHLRSTVYEPMQWERLYLAGDAAHLIPPAGGKGMNLAMADAAELAAALVERFQHGDSSRCDAYSATRLRHTWAAQEFSHWLLDLLGGPSQRDANHEYHQRMQRTQVHLLRTNSSYAASFAERYVGVSPIIE